MRVTAVCAVLLLAAAMPMPRASAQAEPARRGPFARVGVGFGDATDTRFAGTNDAAGVIGSVQAGIGGQRVQFVLGFDLQAFRVEEPIADELVSVDRPAAARFWYLLGGVQFFVGRTFYFRPSLGFARAEWSGPNSAGRAAGHVAAGLAFGGEWRVLARQWIAAEVAWQGATDIQPDAPISETRLLSAKIMFPFY